MPVPPTAASPEKATVTPPTPFTAVATNTPPTQNQETIIPEAISNTLKQILREGKDKNELSVAPSQISGLYEVAVGSEVFYISADGQYILMGEVIDANTRRNLTSEKRSEFRIKVLNSLDESEMVVFAPEKEVKHTINVFTDVDCPYCAKFHNEVPELNKAGIKVRYFAFPRAGTGSDTYKTMVSVWCAKDKKKAMTDAKAGRQIEAVTCNNPVDKQYELGQRLGVTGTPALIFSNGELVPGYLPASRLIPYLEAKALPSLGRQTLRR
jgi:thiol:disulfide interchange protein DsbC